VTSLLMMSGPQFTRPESTGLSGLREMLESYYKLQPKLNQFSSLQKHFSWFGLPCQRKPLTMFWKITASDCRHVCQPTVEILNI